MSRLDDSQEAVIIEHHATRVIWTGDGGGTRETEGVFRVQAESGVQELAVLSFPYTSSNESVDVEYVRVRKPDGAVIDTPGYNIQDMPGNVTRVAPMYSDIREKHVAVKALGVGDVLEFKVRYRMLKSDVPGQFWFEYSFQKNLIVKDEVLEISVPRDTYVNISSPDSEPRVKEEGNRRIYSWRTANLQRSKDAEALQSKREEPPPAVQISTFRTWDEIGRWYRGVQAAQVVHLRVVVVPQVNIGLDASEREGDVVNDLVDELVEVKNGTNLLGCFLHLEQIGNLVTPD